MALSRWTRICLAIPALLLLVVVACGTAAEPPAAPPAPPAAGGAPPAAQPPATGDTPAPTTGDTPAPTVAPAPADAPPAAAAAAGPSGTLNVGHSDLGPFSFHPTTAGNPAIYVVSTTMGEGLMHLNKEGVMAPMLAESWSVSEDFLTWTFNIRPGVQLHKGYGELTAEDVAYSYADGWAKSAIHARGAFIGEFFNHPDGGTTVTDRYTMVVDTGVPWVSVRAHEFLRHIGGTSANVVSKQQSLDMGEEAASRDTALTGSWELESHRTAEFWRLRAVENHWRKTPNFAELVMWEIPEESARLAGFQTGQLDTFVMSFDSISLVESVPGAQIMPGGAIGDMGLNFYGQMYLGVGTPEQHPAFDASRAWVSANPDINSIEWANARLVREALSIAVDREAIVDTLLHGFGRATAVRDWAGFESRMPPHWHWDYDPDRARELLAEAGYPNGFRIDLVTAIRGAPAESETCEAIATMWSDIGIDARLQRIPYETLRPQLVARTYGGATCHNVSQRLEPVLGLSNYIDASVFSYGTFHPWLEENVPAAMNELNDELRFQKTAEVYDWFTMQQVLGVGLYSLNGVVPVGPKIQPWEYVSHSDVRIPNGFENVMPR